MRIAVDLDGVCYEFERTARYMLREYRLPLDGMETESTRWDWIKDNVPKADWDWLWTEGVRLGLFRYGHCVTGSIIGLRSLIDSGHSVLAVTHRPASAVPDTLAWLAYNQVEWTEVHILSNGEPKSTVDADVLIDDKLDNIAEWKSQGRMALIYDRPWNQAPGNHWDRAKTWKDVVKIVNYASLRPGRAAGDRGSVPSVVAGGD